MHPTRLFVVCGLPGSGITARAIELEERFRALRLPADDWMGRLDLDIRDEEVRARIEIVQREMTASALRSGSNVVVAWGTWPRSERDELRSIAARNGALAHLEHLDAPVAELWERVRRRDREQTAGSRTITRADLEEWSSIIERPTVDEVQGYDPMPPVRAGERPGCAAYPYGSWRP